MGSVSPTAKDAPEAAQPLVSHGHPGLVGTCPMGLAASAWQHGASPASSLLQEGGRQSAEQSGS